MKRIVISGGLGNQMFQYAFALALREKYDNVILDISLYNYARMHNGYELERVFGIKESLINKKGLYLLLLRFLLKFNPLNIVNYDQISYDKNNLDTYSLYYYGCWLSEKYFKHVEHQIRNVYTFTIKDEITNGIAQEMISKNSISIHIRRGDYKNAGIPLLGSDYYRRAIEYMKMKVKSSFFYVFTDDEDEGRELVETLAVPFKLINCNKGDNSYKDMFLMSKCKHNIIANSSFSWWGAWLNENEEKIVIAPSYWIPGDENHKPQLDNWIVL